VRSQPTRSRRPRQRPTARRIDRHSVQELLWPDRRRPVFTNRRIRLEPMQREAATADGGLALAHQLVTRVGLDRDINRHLHLLTYNLPYFESDHVLTHAYNLFVGGRYIEDIACLQHSPAVRNLLGACRIPDPTTAGDFLRRFTEADLLDLQDAIDESRVRVWTILPRCWRRQGTLEMDSSLKVVYGDCKQGADFSYKGTWSYHPLLFTLAETGELLRIVNRPGNRPSAEGAADMLGPCLEMLAKHFGQTLVRGDTKFSEGRILQTIIDHGADFVIGHPITPPIHGIALNRKPALWQPFRRRSKKSRPTTARRRKRRRQRQRKARRRGYRTLSTIREWVTEVPFTPAGLDRPVRLVILRKWVRQERQTELLTHYSYRAFVTNLPSTVSPSEVVRQADKRCNQENAIEQAKNGLGAMRMPTGTLLANGAFLMAGQIAWNLRAWLSLLALPRQTLTWEWGWFRRAFVHAPAHIISRSRSAVVRIAGSHRFASYIIGASRRLTALAFT
jgi:hypothetical protein